MKYNPEELVGVEHLDNEEIHVTAYGTRYRLVTIRLDSHPGAYYRDYHSPFLQPNDDLHTLTLELAAIIPAPKFDSRRIPDNIILGEN